MNNNKSYIATNTLEGIKMNRKRLYVIMIATAVVLISIMLITRYTDTWLNNAIPIVAIIGLIALFAETTLAIKVVQAEYKEG